MSTIRIQRALPVVFLALLITALIVPAIGWADSTSPSLTTQSQLPVSGTYENVDWQITTDGQLIIGKEGATQAYSWNPQRSYSGDSAWPWIAYADDVTSIRFAGKVYGYGSQYCMFYNMKNAKTIDLSGFDTSYVYNFAQMFRGCSSVETLDLSGFDTTYRNEDASIYMQYMLADCKSLVSVDVSSFNTSNVVNMEYMFHGDDKLASLDLSSFDTSKVTNMQRMFAACPELASLIIDPEKFNTGKVENFDYMFYNCLALAELDVSGFDTSSATSMDSMFYNCWALEELDVSGFDTSKVVSMKQMFGNCWHLKSLDISSFTADSLVYMSNMLDGLTNLEELTIADFPLSGTGFHGAGGEWTNGYDEMTAEQLERIREHIQKETYHRTQVEHEDAPLYYASGLGEGNMWEVHNPSETFRGYCMNQHRGTAYGSYNKIRVESDADLADIFDTADRGSTHGYEPLGSNMREALIALIYWAEQGGYYEQSDIWHFTNGYDTSNWGKTAAGHTYADIPDADSYVLYLYKSQLGYQNLLSIEGLNPQAYGGVVIHKVDQYNRPVHGAVFGIYDAGGAQVATITSNVEGVAGIFRMSVEDGLPLGTYTIRELQAPRGYEARNTTYTFEVTKDQELVKASTSGATLTFTNDTNEVPGGGIAVKKVNEAGDALSGAEFTIYNASGAEVCRIETDSTGYALTGEKDLELGVAYTLRETKAPIGYLLSTQAITFTLTEDGEFYQVDGDNVHIVDTSKQGSATIEATKVLEGTNLAAGQFTFELYAADLDGKAEGEPLQTATNDADGKVSFKPIAYDATALGYTNYIIREVVGSDSAISYDTHEEAVTVVIEDDESDTLKCTVLYDDDDAVFENTYTAPPMPVEDVSVVITKYLYDALIHESEFTFGLYDAQGNQIGESVSTTLGKRENESTKTSTAIIQFDNLKFTQAGTYSYYIREHLNNAVEVKEGDEFNLQGFEPGFYWNGVKYDDARYEVTVEVTDNNGKLEARVLYPDGETLENYYDEEFVVIGGEDVHVNDYAEEEPKPDSPSPNPSPTSAKATTSKTAPKTGSVKTGDTTPVAPLALVALFAAGGAGLAYSRRRNEG